jgi:hypothetical protein
MTKFVTEILEEINKDPASLEKMKGNGALKYIFEHAFDPEKKFALPEGDPPYKNDAAPQGMSKGNLLMELRKMYVFCRKDLKAIRRETLFIQLLENIHPDEAKVVLAIKDQNLTKMYPKITHKLVYEAGFNVPAPEKKAAKSKNDQSPAGTSA